MRPAIGHEKGPAAAAPETIAAAARIIGAGQPHVC
jgi:hypothetical protein